jgi:hypothetical protein
MEEKKYTDLGTEETKTVEKDNTYTQPAESSLDTKTQSKEKHIIDVKLENKGSAEQVVVIGNVGGDFNWGNDTLVDPTEDCPESLLSGKIWQVDGDINKYTNTLKDQRILVVYSLNSDAADAAILSILLHSSFLNWRKRYASSQKFDTVDIWDNDGKRSIKTTEHGILSIENLTDRKFNYETSTIIFAETQSRSFLDSMSTCSKSQVIGYKERLEKKNAFIILKINSPDLVRRILSIGKNFVFPVWEVSRLSFVLQQTFDLKDALIYEECLLKQNERNLWGDNIDINELAENVSFHLSKSKEIFLQKYYYNQEILENPLSEIAPNANEPSILKPSEFLSKQDNPIVFHLVFIGACFERVTVGEFDMLAYHLLSAPNKNLITGKKTKRTQRESGTYKIEDEEEIEQYKKYVDIWRDEPDDFRKKAHLQRIMLIDSTHHYIDFSEPYLRKAVRDFFENDYPTFVSENFDILFKATFLNLDSSKNLIDNLVRLNASMARQEPATALQRLKTVLSIIREFEEDQDKQALIRLQNTNNDNEDDVKEAVLFSLFQKIKFQEHKNEYFHRIYLLLSEFWNDPVLIPSVKQFLDLLLRNRLFEPVYFLVHRLWNAKDFTPLEWIKQILERGDTDAKSNAFRLLLHASQQELSKSLWEYIDEINTWLPAKDVKVDNFSRTHEYALTFLFQFVFNTSGQIDRGCGNESSLLSPFFSDLDNGLERWTKILTWLYHPGLSHSLFKINRENEVFRVPGPVIAYVLDTWFWQLHGKEEPLSSKTEDIMEEFFKVISTVIALNAYRDTLRFLRIRAESYRDQRSERERYYVLRYFIQLFINKNPF